MSPTHPTPPSHPRPTASAAEPASATRVRAAPQALPPTAAAPRDGHQLPLPRPIWPGPPADPIGCATRLQQPVARESCPWVMGQAATTQACPLPSACAPLITARTDSHVQTDPDRQHTSVAGRGIALPGYRRPSTGLQSAPVLADRPQSRATPFAALSAHAREQRQPLRRLPPARPATTTKSNAIERPTTPLPPQQPPTASAHCQGGYATSPVGAIPTLARQFVVDILPPDHRLQPALLLHGIRRLASQPFPSTLPRAIIGLR